MSETYCGNNKKHPDVVSGVKRIGTRYECLQKGIGVGKASGPDASYAGDYEPVDKRKMYCGKAARMPSGYKLKGSPNMCFRKGFGVGKAMVSRNASSPEYMSGKNYINIVLNIFYN